MDPRTDEDPPLGSVEHRYEGVVEDRKQLENLEVVNLVRHLVGQVVRFQLAEDQAMIQQVVDDRRDDCGRAQDVHVAEEEGLCHDVVCLLVVELKEDSAGLIGVHGQADPHKQEERVKNDDGNDDHHFDD